jgi:hypothetical protein
LCSSAKHLSNFPLKRDQTRFKIWKVFKSDPIENLIVVNLKYKMQEEAIISESEVPDLLNELLTNALNLIEQKEYNSSLEYLN